MSRMYYRIGARYTFTFPATTVQASFTSPVFYTLAKRRFIEGALLCRQGQGFSGITELFASAPLLMRHSGVKMLIREPDEDEEMQVRHNSSSWKVDPKIVVLEFQWSMLSIRPCGQDFPIQCACGALKVNKFKQGARDEEVTVVCQRGCKFSQTLVRNKRFEYVRAGEGGNWYVRTVEPGEDSHQDRMDTS